MGHDYLERSTSDSSPLLHAPDPPYLTAPGPVPTGDQYVDEGTVCDPKDAAHEQLWRHHIDDYCFMSPGQRAREIQKFKDRVHAARDAYGRALDQLRVDELLKKRSDGSWIFDLLLDAIGLVAVPAITRALQKVRSAGPGAVAAVSDAAAAERAVQRTSGGQLTAIVRQAVSSAKKRVPRLSHDASMEAKTSNLQYLAILSRQAEVCFQQLAEGSLADSTDADLIVLTEAYDVTNGHSVNDYKSELANVLSRFEESGVGTIGIAANEHADALHPFELPTAETKAFWVRLPMGPRLALYRRGHLDGMEPGDWNPGFLGVLGSHFVTADESKQRKARDLEHRPFHFERYVPDELVDAAIQMNIARWGSPPTEHDAEGAEWPGLAGGTR